MEMGSVEENHQVDFDEDEPEIFPRVGGNYQAEISPLSATSFYDGSINHTTSDPSEFLMGLQQSILDTGSSVGHWSDIEKDSFLLGLYIFGKNLVLVKKFIGSKQMGDILSFYYREFYRSCSYIRWKSWKKCKRVLGERLFTGSRQKVLLSRLLPQMSEEDQITLAEVSRTFQKKRMVLEEYVFTIKAKVGLSAFGQAVGIGKEEQDLTVLQKLPAHFVPNTHLANGGCLVSPELKATMTPTKRSKTRKKRQADKFPQAELRKNKKVLFVSDLARANSQHVGLANTVLEDPPSETQDQDEEVVTTDPPLHQEMNTNPDPTRTPEVPIGQEIPRYPLNVTELINLDTQNELQSFPEAALGIGDNLDVLANTSFEDPSDSQRPEETDDIQETHVPQVANVIPAPSRTAEISSEQTLVVPVPSQNLHPGVIHASSSEVPYAQAHSTFPTSIPPLDVPSVQTLVLSETSPVPSPAATPQNALAPASAPITSMVIPFALEDDPLLKLPTPKRDPPAVQEAWKFMRGLWDMDLADAETGSKIQLAVMTLHSHLDQLSLPAQLEAQGLLADLPKVLHSLHDDFGAASRYQAQARQSTEVLQGAMREYSTLLSSAKKDDEEEIAQLEQEKAALDRRITLIRKRQAARLRKANEQRSSLTELHQAAAKALAAEHDLARSIENKAIRVGKIGLSLYELKTMPPLK